MADTLLPQKLQRCQLCFANIFDDTEHICAMEMVSFLRTKVYAEPALPIFKLGFIGDLSHLDQTTGKFEKIYEHMILMSASTDGLIKCEESGKWNAITYMATSLKRFTVLVATLSDTNVATFLFRIEVRNHGLRFEKLDMEIQASNGHYNLPPELELNTALVLGVDEETQWAQVDIYTNDGQTVAGFIKPEFVSFFYFLSLC